MTCEQYWHGDVWLVRAYRKAYEYRLKQQNFDAWLQGLYIYRALCDVSPILHAFAKNGTKPNAYLSEPLPLFEKDKREEVRQDEIKAERLRAYAYLDSIVTESKRRKKAHEKSQDHSCQVPCGDAAKDAQCQVPDSK